MSHCYSIERKKPESMSEEQWLQIKEVAKRAALDVCASVSIANGLVYPDILDPANRHHRPIPSSPKIKRAKKTTI